MVEKRSSAKVYPFSSSGSEDAHAFSGPHKPLEAEEEARKYPADFDRILHAWSGKLTTGMSPATLVLAFTDWLLHLSAYPLKQHELATHAAEKLTEFLGYATARLQGMECKNCICPEETDSRFKDEAWQQLPFALYAQGFLLTQDWWRKATESIHGVSQHHSDIVSFMTRQWLDMISPSNFLLTNPEAIHTTIEKKGTNLLKGLHNYLEDVHRFIENRLPRGVENYRIGKDLATTPGKVVYRNHLFELIQYIPRTENVYAEPVLIAPAWIMKYYILDLSPHNSLVSYLLDEGHTVFMISWKNPGKEDRNLGMDNYLHDGALQAMKVVSDIIPNQKIQAVGYCIGGTLMSIAAAYLARHKDERLKSLTLFTTQVDFEEAGELLMFVDESQLAYLEDLMWQQGYLEKWQMSGSFNMLRSKDLIWSRVLREYIKGEDEQMFDLMAWNADATRLPYKMHSEYLRKLYLNNDLAEHNYRTANTPINLDSINVPVFAVATRKDHIAPWKSAYKLHELLNTDLTFLLTTGGHNAGIISEPGHPDRQFQMRHHDKGNGYLSAEDWFKTTEVREGSWWPAWEDWLKKQSGNKTTPPAIGAPQKGYPVLEDAPGTYVFAR